MRNVMQNRQVTYWTGWLSPEMEGTSKEVFGLKGHFPRSMVFGLSRHYWLKASLRGRYVGLNIRCYPLFRLLVPFLEMRTEVNHIYGSMSEWFFLRALRRRPVIMTIAISGTPLDPIVYSNVRLFLTHSAHTSEQLIRWGADPRQVRVVRPGLNLGRFYPAAMTRKKRFRVLFATAPIDLQGFADRGVGLLLDVAATMLDVDFDLLWRPWGDVAKVVQTEVANRGLKNVHVHFGLIGNINERFENADATIAPFLRKDDMKVCPTSLIESLACGRPILVSTEVGIADLVREEMCGEVAEPTVEGICSSIERMRRQYQVYLRNARPCAERHFDLELCLKQHEDLYEEVLTLRR